ncbi:Cyclin_N domain-containing protein/Cyclin_C domain-containing protein [Cephalotus follicularis]|uniref:B-like cyclin n=1 Tax=Cephalotus follicularis TaxID=3775 RepID=A0A1Q3BUU8_CEPFO|nr:Cyclin_N domain-containing protein/Cyclin_C domain-containing protein [Cephalotus follicularis]
MTIQKYQNYKKQEQQNPSFLLDAALYCEEEKCEGIEEVLQEEIEICSKRKNGKNPFLYPLLLLDQDLFLDDDEELFSLFTKEKKQLEQTHFSDQNVDGYSSLSLARCEAVKWILNVNARYGFTTLTAILAIDYLDRFLSSAYFQRDKPWMIQLVAVTCLSVAAKVEEIQVPLLLDLQAEETKYVFEAKTIQRMELLVLSTLNWKMHPVTPLSFLDHIIRRLGLKTHLQWEFLRRCELLLLSLASDMRFISYLPSVLATATMMHVIDQVEPFNPIDYQNQLLVVIKISKDSVNECYKHILELSRTQINAYNNPNKRKYVKMHSSPRSVIDATVFGCDSSNDSWAVGSSVSSSPEPLFKKSRAQEQQHIRLASLNRVLVGILGSPP